MNFLKRKVIALVVALLTTALSIGTAHAGPERYLKKGYIQNDNGEKCWYTQKTNKNSTYFTEV